MSTPPPSVARRSVVAASIGNAMEWYDFSVYAFFASYIAHNFFRDDDPTIGGLILEVKGDFCHQARGMLQRADRDADYLEIGLEGNVCYNPLHNDLEPYAVAYAIAALINNLFGRSGEPFLLRRLLHRRPAGTDGGAALPERL